MKTYEPAPGESIIETAKAMVALAKEHGGVVTADFNEIPLDASPASDPLDIVTSYNGACEERRRAYEASPEYAKAQIERKEREERKASEPAAADGLVERLRDEQIVLRQAEILSGNVVKQAHADGALMMLNILEAALPSTRAEVLEEAAKICEALYEENHGEDEPVDALDCAAAIRSRGE